MLGPRRSSDSPVLANDELADITIGGGYTFTRGNESVAIATQGAGIEPWQFHANGASRQTPFGAETVILMPNATEQFLTVTHPQGPKTWRWTLRAPGLTPRLAVDGTVEFWRDSGPTSLVLLPVSIFDANGRAIGQADLRWSLGKNGSESWLALSLDDSDLPVPYVIDPAATFKAASSAGNGGATTLVVNKPAGVVADDVLVASVTVRDNPTITAPSGWTLVRKDPLIPNPLDPHDITQAIYYKVAGAAEPASYTWTFSTPQKASGGISAYSGVDTTVPIENSSGASGTGMAMTAPSTVTITPDATVVAFFGVARNTGIAVPAGMTERYMAGSTGGPAETRTTSESADVVQSLPGPTGNKTATASQGADWVAQLIVLRPKPPARSTATVLNCPASTPANAPATCTVTVTDTASGTKTPPAGTVGFTFTSQPAGSSASITPNPCVLGPATADSSSCTVTFMADTTGSYTILASYSPAPATLHTASSGSDTITVTARSTTTSIVCPASTPANSPVSCTVTVTDTAGGTQSAPAGSVDFSFTSQPSGSTATLTPDPCVLVLATASSSTCTVEFLADTAGSYTITANYNPAPGSPHSGSTGTDTITVTARTTSTVLDCPPSTPANSPASCTVTVTDTASGTKSAPMGTVDFAFTGQPAGSIASMTPDPCLLAPATASSSTCMVEFLADTPGSYTISAGYDPAPGSVHAASSGVDSITVTARSTSTTVDCPASTPANSPASCTVTVRDTASGTKSPPAGTVDFSITGPSGSLATVTPDPCTLAPDLLTPATDDSVCTISFSADSIGSYTITGDYQPLPLSPHASSSGSDTISVTARSTSTTVDCPASTPANSPASCTVTVRDTASGTKSPPAGTVDFSITGPSGSLATVTPDPCPLVPDLLTPATDDSVCTISFSADSIGSYTITGDYQPAPLSLHASSSGSDTISVTARSTSTTVDCPASTPANSPASCTVTVRDTASGIKSPPAGTVDFTITSQPSGSSPIIAPDPCLLITASTSSSSCMVEFTATTAGSYTIQGTYEPAPTSVHATSTGTDIIAVTAGPAAIVTVDPFASTNPVNSQHCVTATVTDAFGNPKSGVKVFFTVTGVNTASGSRTTGIDGTTAQFCYTGRLFGLDTIKAVADANGNNTPELTEPSGEATKVWTLPPSTAFCVVDFVTYGVKIIAMNGDLANAGGNARVDEAGEPTGQHQYRDHGPAQPMNVHSINVLAVTCSDIEGVPGGKQAQIFGEATIDGAGRFAYRIDVEDRGEPGTNDKYWISLSNGYDSGNQTLVGGNVQIH